MGMDGATVNQSRPAARLRPSRTASESKTRSEQPA
jgi:hypothetical protein